MASVTVALAFAGVSLGVSAWVLLDELSVSVLVLVASVFAAVEVVAVVSAVWLFAATSVWLRLFD